MIEKVRILGHDYMVRFDPKDQIRQDRTGSCNSFLGEIVVAPMATPSQQRDVFIHECIEAINFNLELELKHPQIASLACALYQIFADNPEVLDWIKEVHK